MIVSDAEELAAQFEAAAAGIPAKTKVRMAGWAKTLQAEIVRRAPGTVYPSTIKISGPRSLGEIVVVDIGTDRPDAFRKERGFHRADSRGRHYQAPGIQRDGQKHFEPAVNAIRSAFLDDMTAMAAETE